MKKMKKAYIHTKYNLNPIKIVGYITHKYYKLGGIRFIEFIGLWSCKGFPVDSIQYYEIFDEAEVMEREEKNG